MVRLNPDDADAVVLMFADSFYATVVRLNLAAMVEERVPEGVVSMPLWFD